MNWQEIKKLIFYLMKYAEGTQLIMSVKVKTKTYLLLVTAFSVFFVSRGGCERGHG